MDNAIITFPINHEYCRLRGNSPALNVVRGFKLSTYECCRLRHPDQDQALGIQAQPTGPELGRNIYHWFVIAIRFVHPPVAFVSHFYVLLCLVSDLSGLLPWWEILSAFFMKPWTEPQSHLHPYLRLPSNPSIKLLRQKCCHTDPAQELDLDLDCGFAWYQVKFFWPSSSGWRALSSIRHRAESLITLETVYRRVALAPILRFIDKLPRQQMSGSALAIFFFSYWLFISSHIIRKSVGHGASLFLPRLSLLFSRAGHKDWRFHYLFIYLFIIYYFEDFIFQFVIGRCTRGTF